LVIPLSCPHPVSRLRAFLSTSSTGFRIKGAEFRFFVWLFIFVWNGSIIRPPNVVISPTVVCKTANDRPQPYKNLPCFVTGQGFSPKSKKPRDQGTGENKQRRECLPPPHVAVKFPIVKNLTISNEAVSVRHFPARLLIDGVSPYASIFSVLVTCVDRSVPFPLDSALTLFSKCVKFLSPFFWLLTHLIECNCFDVPGVGDQNFSPHFLTRIFRFFFWFFGAEFLRPKILIVSLAQKSLSPHHLPYGRNSPNITLSSEMPPSRLPSAYDFESSAVS